MIDPNLSNNMRHFFYYSKFDGFLRIWTQSAFSFFVQGNPLKKLGFVAWRSRAYSGLFSFVHHFRYEIVIVPIIYGNPRSLAHQHQLFCLIPSTAEKYGCQPQCRFCYFANFPRSRCFDCVRKKANRARSAETKST